MYASCAVSSKCRPARTAGAEFLTSHTCKLQRAEAISKRMFLCNGIIKRLHVEGLAWERPIRRAMAELSSTHLLFNTARALIPRRASCSRCHTDSERLPSALVRQPPLTDHMTASTSSAAAPARACTTARTQRISPASFSPRTARLLNRPWPAVKGVAVSSAGFAMRDYNC